jgi:hypothetical protein
MKKRWLSVSYLIVCAAWLVLPISLANGLDESKILKELQETIANVRAMSGPSMARTNAAEHLSELTKKIDPKKVDDKTLGDLISLLGISDDSVRGWVAGALGYLGPRAKAAAPGLLKLIRETDCPKVATGVRSADAARVALKRIGVTPPPRDCGMKGE